MLAVSKKPTFTDDAWDLDATYNIVDAYGENLIGAEDDVTYE